MRKNKKVYGQRKLLDEENKTKNETKNKIKKIKRKKKMSRWKM